MKNRKLQFSLATLFVATTIVGIMMSGYRYRTYVEERVQFHTRKRDSANTGMVATIDRMNVFLESREALLAGDEDRLENLATRFHVGQPMEIAYVPVQLAILDRDISKLRVDYTRGEAVKKYHAEMVVEFEKSRWRPWHRMPELTPPSESISRADIDAIRTGDNTQLLPIVEK